MSGGQRLRRRLAAALAGMALACSPVRATYLRAGYSGDHPQAVKRVAVLGWGPPQGPLAVAAAHVAAELIKLRRNYLVQRVEPATHWAAGCRPASDGTAASEGVLWVQALESQATGRKVALSLVAELYRCEDGALLWRAEAAGKNASDDPHLSHMTATYTSALGPQVAPYVAPAFVLLQRLIETLPDPVLSDEDVLEKIELG